MLTALLTAGTPSFDYTVPATTVPSWLLICLLGGFGLIAAGFITLRFLMERKLIAIAASVVIAVGAFGLFVGAVSVPAVMAVTADEAAADHRDQIREWLNDDFDLAVTTDDVTKLLDNDTATATALSGTAVRIQLDEASNGDIHVYEISGIRRIANK